MKKRKKRYLVLFLSIIFLVFILAIFTLFSVRGIIISIAESEALTMSTNIANRVISENIKQNGIAYSDIVLLSRNSDNNISALEIDMVNINSLKGIITTDIADTISKNSEYEFSIPIGTLLGSEYTIGLGPRIQFKMQITSSVFTDFESNFYSAGINQVLHQILIKVNISGKLVLPWQTKGFDTETSVIAAQTVLVGVTPEAYTNVIEMGSESCEDTVPNIFDYGAGTK